MSGTTCCQLSCWSLSFWNSCRVHGWGPLVPRLEPQLCFQGSRLLTCTTGSLRLCHPQGKCDWSHRLPAWTNQYLSFRSAFQINKRSIPTQVCLCFFPFQKAGWRVRGQRANLLWKLKLHHQWGKFWGKTKSHSLQIFNILIPFLLMKVGWTNKRKNGIFTKIKRALKIMIGPLLWGMGSRQLWRHIGTGWNTSCSIPDPAPCMPGKAVQDGRPRWNSRLLASQKRDLCFSL